MLRICGFGVICAFLLSSVVTAADKLVHDPELEKVPEGEAKQIENIVKLTVEQMKQRYDGDKPVLRGVHPKDHGCVQAKFRVLADLPENLRVGVFAKPGKEYESVIRFSNAVVLVTPDSSPTAHGSRGMAIKLLAVEGKRLMDDYAPEQDFLMVNHPVFAFPNVEDYEALSEVLLKDRDNPARYFLERIKPSPTMPDLSIPMTRRAVTTAGIVKRIQSLSLTGPVPAFQAPPASPVDNQYFSGAPYGLGPDQAMKYSAKPVAPGTAAPDIADPNYLRTALLKQLTAADAKPIVFDFLVQARTKAQLAGKIETEIEDACAEWKDTFIPVAKITIPPQNFDTPEAKTKCEELFFTPWHSLVDHQPLGGINRLKLGVYNASSKFRHTRK